MGELSRTRASVTAREVSVKSDAALPTLGDAATDVYEQKKNRQDEKFGPSPSQQEDATFLRLDANACAVTGVSGTTYSGQGHFLVHAASGM